MRWIFHAYVETGLSIRQIALDLLDRGIPSPTGNPAWGTSTITRLLNNEAYIGTIYYNRRESLEGNGPRGARNYKTRNRERPREEWIPIPVPAIIGRDTFDRVKQIKRDNSKWNPRGAEWGVWLLRGLIECGHCHLGCNCHRMRGRNGTWHRYYYCRGHDVLRAHSPEGRCPERNIRADELDQYVWAQVRQVLLDPRQLIAGERAVIAGTPADENELVTAQLRRLDTALDSNERERTRLLDAYQAGLLELDELTRRTAALTARRGQLVQEKTTLTKRSAELATENRLRRRLAGFAEQVAESLDDLDIDGRRRLLRLVVEKIRVTGWRVEIHLKIPLPDDPPDDDPPKSGPEPDNGPSSDMRLRSLRDHRRPRQLPARASHRREGGPTTHLAHHKPANPLVGRFVATSGEKRWPPMGKFVAASGENSMAIDNATPRRRGANHRRASRRARTRRNQFCLHGRIRPVRRRRDPKDEDQKCSTLQRDVTGLACRRKAHMLGLASWATEAEALIVGRMTR